MSTHSRPYRCAFCTPEPRWGLRAIWFTIGFACAWLLVRVLS